jgi:catechol 2,3-dioxygenase-like lactoylglutathione lyase family enzyme
MIGSLESVVLDCPDPNALAAFYVELLGGEIVDDNNDWTEVLLPSGRPILAFQQVDGYNPPQWPGQDVPQQFHLDVKVADLNVGEKEILRLGATATGDEHPTFRVYLDPAGHPFCLVLG